MSPDLNAPGWVQVAGEWRWTGAGAPPGGVAAWEIAHEDYCGYPDDCRCLKVRPHADARTTERYIKETVAGADERRKQPPVDDDLDALRSRLAERPSRSAFDDPVCIVCETAITPDRDFTRSPEGHCWHYGCRRGVAAAFANMEQNAPEGCPMSDKSMLCNEDACPWMDGENACTCPDEPAASDHGPVE